MFGRHCLAKRKKRKNKNLEIEISAIVAVETTVEMIIVVTVIATETVAITRTIIIATVINRRQTIKKMSKTKRNHKIVKKVVVAIAEIVTVIDVTMSRTHLSKIRVSTLKIQLTSRMKNLNLKSKTVAIIKNEVDAAVEAVTTHVPTTVVVVHLLTQKLCRLTPLLQELNTKSKNLKLSHPL